MHASFDLMRMLESDDLVLWYKGLFDDVCTAMMVEINSADLEKKPLPKGGSTVSFLLTECFQNIIRHGMKESFPDKVDGVFGWRRKKNTWHIYSANRAEPDQILEVKKRLDMVNSLDKEELKSYYLEVLEKGTFSDKGGAGLGFVEMARKSGNPVQFGSFFKENSNYLCLQVDFDKSPESIEMPISENIRIHNCLLENNVGFIFKGDFSRENIIPVLEILSANGRSLSLNQAFKLQQISIEFLQNISRHAKDKDGMRWGWFMLQYDKVDFVLSTINLVDEEQKKVLEKELEELNALELSEQDANYIERLRASTLQPGNDAGTGLPDVRRLIKGKIQYEFKPARNDYYYQISVTF